MVIRPYGYAIWELMQQGARPPLQGDRPRERLLPAVHPREPADEGGRARRRLRAAGRVGDAGRQRGARGAARRPADVRDDHRHDVRQVDPVVARPADPDQPVGERRALGEGDAAVPAHDRVPLAGRAHGARDGRGGRGRDAQDARRLQGLRRDRAGDAGHGRPEDREREVRRRRSHVFDRGADARRPGAAGRHVAQPRAELFEELRHQVPGARQVGAVRLDDVVGRVDAHDRRRDHDARRRGRADPAATDRALSGRDRADPPRATGRRPCCRRPRRFATSSSRAASA